MSKLISNVASLILLNIFLAQQSNIIGLELKPYCGFPGKPYRAKIIPEEKLVFIDGDKVSYQCADYWAPPQVKTCINGQWEGPLVRCGDFIPDLLMREARMIDLTNNKLMFNHTNMNITSTDWKHPNSFTSNRFKKARLRVIDDHPYLWSFKFNRPAIKLFCKLNFNFLNFSSQSEEFKKAFEFYVNISISLNRTCRQEYQSHNSWRQDGNRIDTSFICEANSLEALRAEIANPPNMLEVRTKTSHNITYELIALFFGRVYGNETEPLCGEPELEYGQIFRANQEFRDYMIDCARTENWIDTNPLQVKSFNYPNRCFGDMLWNGTRPRCQPKKTCLLFNVNKYFTTQAKNATHHNNVIIDSISKFYFEPENETVHATVGTEVVYTCSSDDYVLIGKDHRTCKEDFKWTGAEPICKFIKSSNELIESSNYLLIIIICMAFLLILILILSCVLFIFYTRRQNQRRKKKLANQQNSFNQMYDQANIYDNIELTLEDKDDGLYEVYERIDGEPNNIVKGGKLTIDSVRYSEPNQYTTYYLNNDEDSYIRMFEHQALNSTLNNRQDDNVIVRDKPNNIHRVHEPSYLELLSK